MIVEVKPNSRINSHMKNFSQNTNLLFILANSKIIGSYISNIGSFGCATGIVGNIVKKRKKPSAFGKIRPWDFFGVFFVVVCTK